MSFKTKEAEIFYKHLSRENERTGKAYARDVDRLLDYIGKPPEAISAMDVDIWLDSLEEHSNRSKDRYCWSIKRFLKYMGRHALSEQIPKIQYRVEEPLWASQEEIERLLDNSPLYPRLIFEVTYDRALRPGEIALLRKDQYNPDTGAIIIRRLKHKGRPNEYSQMVSPEVRESLNEFLESKRDENPRIFPVSTSYCNKQFAKARDRSRLNKGYTLHTLRHSRITHIAIKELEEKGFVDELSLAKFAGHIRIETTRLYIHLGAKHLAFRS